jgi:hypothetical protein
LAERLGLDSEAFRANRNLSLITTEEARELATEGVDLQLHTYWHRTSIHRDRFLREIVDNRDSMAGKFTLCCYPSGLRRANDAQWLEELGIKSSTTCEPGLVAPGSKRHSLARVVDSSLTEADFLGWVHGTAALLPCRARSHDMDQLPEESEIERPVLC